MIITVGALAIGLVVGLARGGRIRNLTRVNLRWIGVGVAGLFGLASIRFGSNAAPELLLATSLALCAAFALRNLRVVGLGVVGIGLLANLAPLLANGYVPVEPDALVHAGLVERHELEEIGLRGGRAVADADTRLGLLGQRIPVPELGIVLSFGDIIVAVGLADALSTSLRRRRRGGLPVADIFAAEARAEEARRAAAAATTTVTEERTIVDLTVDPPRTRRERPVEVGPGQPIPIPMGWGRPTDDDLAGGRTGEGAASSRPAGPLVPWPWRTTPPRPHHHPTMRAGRR